MMTMMCSQLVCCLLFLALLSFQTAFGGFAGVTSSQRVFVGTPVSDFPKHLVADRMTSNPKTLHPDTTVDEAILTLMSWGVTGAPIVDDRTDSKLLGVVSSYDFLQKEAFEGAVLAMEGTSQQVETYVNAARRICGQRISDIMTTNPRTVSPNDPMRVAAELMSNERLHHLPVVDDHGNLLGILTPSDVMMDIVHVVRNLPPATPETGAEEEVNGGGDNDADKDAGNVEEQPRP